VDHDNRNLNNLLWCTNRRCVLLMQPQTEAEVFTHLSEQLRLAEEAAYILGHYYKAQDDFELGQGFLAVGEMLRMTQINIMNLATKGLRNAAGFK
jgi:hypothetical protein